MLLQRLTRASSSRNSAGSLVALRTFLRNCSSSAGGDGGGEKERRDSAKAAVKDERTTHAVNRNRHTQSLRYKFVDRASLKLQGGEGGKGCAAYEMLGAFKKKPSGGNGGHGGDVS
jgi:hypothetical protein